MIEQVCPYVSIYTCADASHLFKPRIKSDVKVMDIIFSYQP